MSFIFQYVIKLSVSLGAVYLFYYFFLRRLTFYNSNRWYLLLYSFSSFLIPFVNISPLLQKNELDASSIIRYIPIVSTRISISNPVIAEHIPYTDLRMAGRWLIAILVIGMIVMFVRLLMQYFSYLRVKQSSRLLVDEPIKIFQVDRPIIPFSIGNSIFINQHLHKEEELKEIIRHEFIHVKQKHSVDIFLSELLCVLNWFNPFAWMIRKAIRQNLEFIADNKVLEGGLDKKHYQRLLLKVIGISQFSISSQFNFSSLKKRIAMMNKKQSTKAQLLKLLLLLPVLTIILLAFRGAGRNNHLPFSSVSWRDNIDTVPAPPPPPKPAAPDNPQFPELNEFLNRNPQVKTVHTKNGQLIIELKSGEKETYDLSDEKKLAAAEKKYGELPVPPPPLPPPKPNLPKGVKNVHIKNEKAVVELTNGKTEQYDFSKPGEREEFEKKYGELQPPSDSIRGEELYGKELLDRKEEELKKQELMEKLQERQKEIAEMKEQSEKELNREVEMKREELMRASNEKQRELTLMRKQYEMESGKDAGRRREELMKASKNKEMELDLMKKQFEMETDRESDLRRQELMNAANQKEQEMQLMKQQFEMETGKAAELRRQKLTDLSYELLAQKEILQRQHEMDQKGDSKMNKGEMINQLELQRRNLLQTIQELKFRELELNKQLQQLKMNSSKKN